MKHRYLAFTQWQGTLKKSVYGTKVFYRGPALTRAFCNSDPTLSVIACRSDPFSIISLKVKPSKTHRVMLHLSKCDNFGINNHDRIMTESWHIMAMSQTLRYGDTNFDLHKGCKHQTPFANTVCKHLQFSALSLAMACHRRSSLIFHTLDGRLCSSFFGLLSEALAI